MYCRGIRGATTVESNTREAILEATDELLRQMIEVNDIRVEDVAYAMFTTTSDLDAEFPAVAARHLGWTEAALLCGREIDVPGSLHGVHDHQAGGILHIREEVQAEVSPIHDLDPLRKAVLL